MGGLALASGLFRKRRSSRCSFMLDLYRARKFLVVDVLYRLLSKLLTRPPHLNNIFRRYVCQKMRVLDIGCGFGIHEPSLAKLADQVVAIDISPEFIKEARRRFSRAKYLIADAENLPFKDASFDLSLLIVVLHHVRDDERALAEASRTSRLTILWEQIYDYRPFISFLQRYEAALLDGSKRYELSNLKALIAKLGGRILEEHITSPIQNSYICVIEWKNE